MQAAMVNSSLIQGEKPKRTMMKIVITLMKWNQMGTSGQVCFRQPDRLLAHTHKGGRQDGVLISLLFIIVGILGEVFYTTVLLLRECVEVI